MWLIDACCLLRLCFTGSCSRYSDATGFLRVPNPDTSSWFPVGGSYPATTSLLHHPHNCLPKQQLGKDILPTVPICPEFVQVGNSHLNKTLLVVVFLFFDFFFLWENCWVWMKIIYHSCINKCQFVKMLNAFTITKNKNLNGLWFWSLIFIYFLIFFGGVSVKHNFTHAWALRWRSIVKYRCGINVWSSEF